MRRVELEQLEAELRATLAHPPGEPKGRYPDHPPFEVDGRPFLRLVRPTDEEPVLLGRRRRGWWSGWKPAAIAAAVALVTAGSVVFGGAAPGSNGVASASSVLTEAADNVSTSAVPGPGQYLYTREATMQQFSDMGNGQTWQVDLPGMTESWMGVSSIRIKYVPGNPTFPSASDRTAWVEAGSPSLGEGQGTDQTGPVGSFLSSDESGPDSSPNQAIARDNEALIFLQLHDGLIANAFSRSVVQSLPTDPTALRDLLVNGYEGGHSDVVSTFCLAASLLYSGTSQDQQAAIFRMLAALSGVTLQGSVTTDVTGQIGTALSVSNGTGTYTIVVSPSSGALLEVKFTLVLSDNANDLGPTDDTPSGRDVLFGGYTVFEAFRSADSMTASE